MLVRRNCRDGAASKQDVLEVRGGGCTIVATALVVHLVVYLHHSRTIKSARPTVVVYVSM